MFASVAPREVLARLRRGVAKPQVKPLIGVTDPYRPSRFIGRRTSSRSSHRSTHPTDIAAHTVYFAVVFVVYIRSDMVFMNAESGCWVTPRTWTR
jgi:hypothetical protein